MDVAPQITILPTRSPIPKFAAQVSRRNTTSKPSKNLIFGTFISYLPIFIFFNGVQFSRFPKETDSKSTTAACLPDLPLFAVIETRPSSHLVVPLTFSLPSLSSCYWMLCCELLYFCRHRRLSTRSPARAPTWRSAVIPQTLHSAWDLSSFQIKYSAQMPN